MATKHYIGVLILVLLVSSIYIMLPDSVRIDVQKTRNLYKVYENDKWVLAATEYVNLFDGSAKMRAKNRSLDWYNDSGIITITRIANYKDKISTHETYVFDSSIDDVELVPVSHETTCINCVGKILHFEYRNILYDGETKDITSPFSFGHNMKLTWQDGAYRAKVYQQISVDKIILRYRPVTDIETFEVRLFDPLEISWNVIQGCKKKIVYDACERNVVDHYFNVIDINNKTGINKTSLSSINYTENYNCNPYEVDVDCKTIGVKTNNIKITCPENTRCDIIGTNWCMIDCGDGDCNVNAKKHLKKGWSRDCIPIQDLRGGMKISISDFKKTSTIVEKLSVLK